MDALTRDRLVRLAGIQTRAFDPNQLRNPNTGEWIDTGLVKRIVGDVKDAIDGATTRVDWRGIHITAPVRGQPVTVTISPIDLAALALLAVPGAGEVGATVEVARAALVVRRIRQALAVAKAAETVAGAVKRSDVLQAEERHRLMALLGLAEERGHPHPGQHYKHGWIPVAAEVLTTDELNRDYGDELDRVEIGDTCVVARPGVVTIERESAGQYEVLASPGPADAAEWAGQIEGVEPGDEATGDGLHVSRAEDGGLSLSFNDADAVELAPDQAAAFVAALRDLSYTAEDAVTFPDEIEESDGDETPLPDPVSRHRSLQLLGLVTRAAGVVDAHGHLHAAKGTKTGGQFAKISTRVLDTLKAWLDAGATHPDPLAAYSQPQLKTAATQLGLNPPKGMKYVPLKGLLMTHAKNQHVDWTPVSGVAPAPPSVKTSGAVFSDELFDLGVGKAPNTLLATASMKVGGLGPIGSFTAETTDDGKVWFHVEYPGGSGVGHIGEPGAVDWPFTDVEWTPEPGIVPASKKTVKKKAVAGKAPALTTDDITQMAAIAGPGVLLATAKVEGLAPVASYTISSGGASGHFDFAALDADGEQLYTHLLTPAGLESYGHLDWQLAAGGPGGVTAKPLAVAAAAKTPAKVGKPVPTGTAGASIDHVSDATKKLIFSSYKAQPTGQLLSSPTADSYDNLVAVAHVYGPKVPGGLTVLQTARIADEQLAAAQGVNNGHLLEKKLKDWLATADGAAYAKANKKPRASIVDLLTGKVTLPKGVKLKPGEKVQKVAGPGAYKPGQLTIDFKAHTAPQMQALQDAHMASTGTTWTSEQEAALVNYSGGGYTGMNGYLRGTGGGSALVQQRVVQMQSAMMPLQENALLLRGTSWDQLPDGFRGMVSAKQLLGKTFQEPAFTSTSVAGSGGHFSSKPVLFEIEAPAGTRGVFLRELSKHASENEVVLAAGTKYRALKVTSSGGQTVIRLRVVTPK